MPNCTSVQLKNDHGQPDNTKALLEFKLRKVFLDGQKQNLGTIP